MVICGEVKATARVSTADFRGLRDLVEAAKERFTAGIVFYTGDRVIYFGNNLAAVPIALL